MPLSIVKLISEFTAVVFFLDKNILSGILRERNGRGDVDAVREGGGGV